MSFLQTRAGRPRNDYTLRQEDIPVDVPPNDPAVRRNRPLNFIELQRSLVRKRPTAYCFDCRPSDAIEPGGGRKGDENDSIWLHEVKVTAHRRRRQRGIEMLDQADAVNNVEFARDLGRLQDIGLFPGYNAPGAIFAVKQRNAETIVIHDMISLNRQTDDQSND